MPDNEKDSPRSVGVQIKADEGVVPDHPWKGDKDGHNCRVCADNDDALHLCWREAHPPKWSDDADPEVILDYDDEPSAAVKNDRAGQAGYR